VINNTEKTTALTFASWLDSVATQGARTSSLLLLLALVAVVFDTNSQSQTTRMLMIVVFGLHGLVMWPLERVFCLRLNFDAKLFKSIGLGRYSALADLDDALNHIGLRKNTNTPTRDLTSRITGTRRLLRLYTWVLGGQFLLTMIAFCLR
jgi:hypothetical protein